MNESEAFRLERARVWGWVIILAIGFAGFATVCVVEQIKSPDPSLSSRVAALEAQVAELRKHDHEGVR